MSVSHTVDSDHRGQKNFLAGWRSVIWPASGSLQRSLPELKQWMGTS